MACRWLMFFWLLCMAQIVGAQDVFGKWKTIDDKSGKPKAIVEIYKKGGLVYGKILRILEEGRQDAICEKCKGDQKNKPIVGMNVIKALKEEDGQYKHGRLFDPEYGVEVRGKIWLHPEDPDKLKVRGYLAFLYRTQTWQRVKDE